MVIRTQGLMDVKLKVSTYHQLCYKLSSEGFTKYGAVKVLEDVMSTTLFCNLPEDFSSQSVQNNMNI